MLPFTVHLLSGIYLGELVLKVKSMLAFNDIHYILPFPSCQVFTLLPVCSFQWFVTLKKKTCSGIFFATLSVNCSLCILIQGLKSQSFFITFSTSLKAEWFHTSVYSQQVGSMKLDPSAALSWRRKTRLATKEVSGSKEPEQFRPSYKTPSLSMSCDDLS